MSVRCFVSTDQSRASRTEVPVCSDMKVASCAKDFGRFVSFVVRTSNQRQAEDSHRRNAFAILAAGQAQLQRSLEEGRLPSRKDVIGQPRGNWLLYNALIDMLEGRNLGFIGDTMATSGKEFLDALTTVLFEVLVPDRLERMSLRNVHVPQLFAELLGKSHRGTGFNKPQEHGHTKLPELTL